MAKMFIYVIGPNNGPQKIGISNNVKARLDTLQCGCPFDLRIHAAVELPSEMTARRAELMAHRILRASRQRGEWFNVSWMRAEEIVRIAASSQVSDGDVPAGDRLVMMREEGALTWDEYEAALAFHEVLELAAHSALKDGRHKGYRQIERRARATAIAKTLAELIRRAAGDEALRVLVRLTAHGIEPSQEEFGPLRRALLVVAEKLEHAASAKAA